MSGPLLSVVVPTRNRSALLDRCLASFEKQILPRQEFEIVVVDDGSTDTTEATVERWAERLPVRAWRQSPAGASAARNLGLFAARGELVLFFDDDEVATESLLAEHVRAHREHSQPHQAILGQTTWAPGLAITPLMHYVVDVGCYLLSYRYVPVDRPLEFHQFWTGRVSCKRRFLTSEGIFSPTVRRLEDIDLGFRLQRKGMELRYRPTALNYKPDGVGFRDFLRRVEVDGAALVRLRERYPDDAAMKAYCALEGARERWRAARPRLAVWASEAERRERAAIEAGTAFDDPALEPLWGSYKRCFQAVQDRGISTALGGSELEL